MAAARLVEHDSRRFLNEEFFFRSALELAPSLLGCELVHVANEGVTAGLIVETESYSQDDEGSHSYSGQTQRNSPMFGPGGWAYVYFTYGMHYCFNVVAGKPGFAEAVLIRALQPTQGMKLMAARRQTNDPYNLCSGPAKLVKAMDLGACNGASLVTPELHILPREPNNHPKVIHSPRIGIRRAIDRPWRFFIEGNPYVTKHKFNRPVLK